MGNTSVCEGDESLDESEEEEEKEEEKEEGVVDDDTEEDIPESPSKKFFTPDIGFENISDVVAKSHGKSTDLFRCTCFGRSSIMGVYKKLFIFSHVDVAEVFRTTTNLMKVLRHENLLVYHGTTQPIDRKVIGVLHEWYDNGTVEDFIQSEYRVPLNTKRKLDFLLQVCVVMYYLHCSGVIHGSLSWNSFLMCENLKSIKLYDFGLHNKILRAKQEYEDGFEDCEPYDIRYVGPEVLEDRRLYYKSDVFSFSIMLYELVCNDKSYNPMKANSYYKDNPVTRPPVEKSNVFNEPLLEWIVDLMRSCWDENINNRPTFQEIHEIIEENYDNTVDSIGPFDEQEMDLYHKSYKVASSSSSANRKPDVDL